MNAACRTNVPGTRGASDAETLVPHADSAIFRIR